MRYRKIRASWKENKEQLNRVFLIDESMGVLEFTIIIQKLFHMNFVHLPEITANGCTFSLYDDALNADDTIDSLSWNETGQRFVFSYGEGQTWEFDVFVFKRPVELDSDQRVLLQSGAGMGIWEDALHEFWYYGEYGYLPKDKGYDDFIPSNLKNVKSLKQAMQFDLKKEQKYITLFLNTDFRRYLARYQAANSRLFDGFLMSAAALRTADDKNDDNASVTYAKKAEEEFFAACEKLKQDEGLPDMIADLEKAYHLPDDPSYLLTMIPMILIEQECFDEAMEYAEELFQYFPLDPAVRVTHDSVRINCLAKLGKTKEAHAILDALEKEAPEEPNIIASRVFVYICEERYEEAEKLLSKYVSEDEEPISEHYGLYLYAYDLYSRIDPKTAEIYDRKLNLLESRMGEEDLYAEEFTEANEELAFETNRFLEYPGQIRYSLATACFVILCQMDGYVIVAIDRNDLPKSVFAKDGGEYLAVYSKPETAANEKDDITPVQVRAVLEIAIESQMSGICVDPDEYGYGLYINTETLENIQKVTDEEERKDDRLPLLLS